MPYKPRTNSHSPMQCYLWGDASLFHMSLPPFLFHRGSDHNNIGFYQQVFAECSFIICLQIIFCFFFLTSPAVPFIHSSFVCFLLSHSKMLRIYHQQKVQYIESLQDLSQRSMFKLFMCFHDIYFTSSTEGTNFLCLRICSSTFCIRLFSIRNRAEQQFKCPHLPSLQNRTTSTVSRDPLSILSTVSTLS